MGFGNRQQGLLETFIIYFFLYIYVSTWDGYETCVYRSMAISYMDCTLERSKSNKKKNRLSMTGIKFCIYAIVAHGTHWLVRGAQITWIALNTHMLCSLPKKRKKNFELGEERNDWNTHKRWYQFIQTISQYSRIFGFSFRSKCVFFFFNWIINILYSCIHWILLRL